MNAERSWKRDVLIPWLKVMGVVGVALTVVLLMVFGLLWVGSLLWAP